MKSITVPKFEHTLIAPKGFKFNLNKQHCINIAIGVYNDITFTDNDTCFKWINNIKDPEIGSFNKYLKNYIIEINNCNHYTWLKNNLEEFWQKALGKTLAESKCTNIISYHADKCYQYREKWLNANIPFFYGLAIYLLRYAPEFQNILNEDGCQWVIDNYEKYSKLLPLITEDEHNYRSSKVSDTIILKDEMWVCINPLMIKRYMDNNKGKQLLSTYGHDKIQLTYSKPNSNRVVNGQIMIKGLGIFDKKYFTEVEV